MPTKPIRTAEICPFTLEHSQNCHISKKSDEKQICPFALELCLVQGDHVDPAVSELKTSTQSHDKRIRIGDIKTSAGTPAERTGSVY